MMLLCECENEANKDYWQFRCETGDGYDCRYDGYHLDDSKVIKTTEKSYLIRHHSFGIKWVPKSQSIACERCRQVTVSAWLANKLKLAVPF